MTNDLNGPKRRAIQYWYVDGTFEFGFGALCLLLAIYFYIQATMPSSLLSNILSTASVVIIIGGILGGNWLIRLLKERLTYPRTGYVAYRREYGLKRSVRIAIILTVSGIVSALLILFFARRPAALDWMPGVTGLIFGGVMLLLAYRSAITRFYLLAAFSIVSGMGLSIFGLGNVLGLAFFYGLTSLALFTFGGVTLWRYLSQSQKSTED